MAQFYTIKCPKCGCEFNVAKGVFWSWDFSKPIPEELRDETPFDCPDCHHIMCVKDDDLYDHVVNVIDGD